MKIRKNTMYFAFKEFINKLVKGDILIQDEFILELETELDGNKTFIFSKFELLTFKNRFSKILNWEKKDTNLLKNIIKKHERDYIK